MDIATDMDLESLLTLLLIKKAKLIKLRDKHMIFSVHVQIEALDKDIRDVQSIINGKCCF